MTFIDIVLATIFFGSISALFSYGCMSFFTEMQGSIKIFSCPFGQKCLKYLCLVPGINALLILMLPLSGILSIIGTILISIACVPYMIYEQIRDFLKTKCKVSDIHITPESLEKQGFSIEDYGSTIFCRYVTNGYYSSETFKFQFEHNVLKTICYIQTCNSNLASRGSQYIITEDSDYNSIEHYLTNNCADNTVIGLIKKANI